MTKKQLIDAMADLDDDAEVHVYCMSADTGVRMYAYDAYTYDKVSGSDVQNEITIVAHF